MGYVTKEQIEKAKQVDILDYIRTFEANNLKRVGNSYRLKDHDSLAIAEGKWFWHSRGFGGRTALQFLIDVRDYNFVDAVCLLINETSLSHTSSINKTTNNTLKPNLVEKIPFKLPIINQDNKRAIAYLLSRGIDKDTILDCIEKGKIYENKQFHNVVFLGKDINGKTRYAAMRSTSSNFKRDVDGSDKSFGFVLESETPNSNKLALFEAPIDCLSHLSLCKKGYIQPFDGWRLSLGGTSTRAVEYFLQNHKEISHCIIATDNDTAGNETAIRSEKLINSGDYKIKTLERAPPQVCKDWNDMLQHLLKKERSTQKHDLQSDRS